MTIFQIEVRARSEQHDTQAHRLAREIIHLPLKQLPSLSTILADQKYPTTLRTAQLYLITGKLSPTNTDKLITNLLVDPVVQEARISADVAVHDHPLSSPLPDSRVDPGGQPGLQALSAWDAQQRAEYSRVDPGGQPYVVDVFYHSGVTDTLAESVLAGAKMLGLTGLEHVETGRRYFLDSRLSETDVRAIVEALLYNPVIQQYTLRGKNEGVQCIAPPGPTETEQPQITQSIPICNMADQQLLELSQKGLLALNLEEMRAIQKYYREQGREPTDVELETLAQTWSEHCSHKTFKASIVYREVDNHGNVLADETINGLLKHYLMRATEQVKREWLVSAFSDNAGIIRFTGTQDIAFKVETHNHPSAIEPFGGANTGVGGVIRDVLGVSAQPIACTDILCFGPPETPIEELPPGILSPRRIASGVVNGVRDYGNKMGIPTVNGAILYHPGYLYNPLVFCGCLGILPHGSHPRQVQPGDHIVVLGGRTGRDGIHGATFSSGEMSRESNAQAGSAVQIGAPITEKKLVDVIIQARDRQGGGLYHAITDCGAGGFSSAIGEMGAETGADVDLGKAPLKYQGLAPWEIWLSEAQERMVLAVSPECLDELLEICEIEEVEASIVGTFTNSHHLVVTFQGTIVANLEMQFLHDGRPEKTLEALWVGADLSCPSPIYRPQESTGGLGVIKTINEIPGSTVGADLSCPSPIYRPSGKSPTSPHPFVKPHNWAPTLLTLLSHPSIASKEDVIRRYDHEVQGGTILKPLVGRAGNGPGDAAVLLPILDEPSKAGIVLANGVNPLYGQIDPYHMAMNAIDEALRNLTAVGGDIEKAAILDNFCWGNPTDPAQLGMLVRAVKGCHDAAIGFGTPFISGKDSLNNEYRTREQRLPVIPTLVISAVGVIDDAAQTVDMSLKRAGNLIYQVGATRNELAGSHYAEIVQVTVAAAAAAAAAPGTTVPQVDLTTARTTMKAVGAAIRTGLVQSCHDLSEGGLAVAAAEMSLAGLLGMTIDLEDLRVWAPFADAREGVGVPKGGRLSEKDTISTILLFSESPSRFLVEVAPLQQEAFEAHMRLYGINDVSCIGLVTGEGSVYPAERSGADIAIGEGYREGEAERFLVRHGEETLIDLPIVALQQAWKGGQA